MAERAVNVVAPRTGEHGSVSQEQFARARAAGARQQTENESAALIEEARHDNIPEAHWASTVGIARGLGETVGMPTDAFATGVADVFGKRGETQRYLNDLRKYHPLASGAGEVAGQVGGAIALAELTGGGAAAPAETAAGRIAQGAGSAALRGGLENLVVGSTHDVNETQLGNADLAGEKLLAEMPKHFALGFGVSGLVGGGGAALGEAARFLRAPVSEALDQQATKALGREFGGDAALGAEIRAKAGGVPSSRGALVDILTGEQAAVRQASTAEAMAARDALEASHTTAAWGQSAKSEAARLASAKEARAAVQAVESRHAAARDALKQEHAEAASAFAKLSGERDVARKQLKSLAADLDKVKGAELPNAQNIMREAGVAFQSENGLTPASPRAVELFNEWSSTFLGRYSEPGKLTFTELQGAIKSLDTMEVRQRVVSGWGSDPEVKRAFDAIKSSAKAEFDRASAATAAGVSEAKGLHAERLRASVPELDKAMASAEENLDRLGGLMKDFERGASQELKQAEREGFQAMRSQQRVSSKEEKALGQQQRAEVRELPRASKSTPVDDLLRRARQPQEQGGIGAMGLMGAGAMLLHGNVAGAAMSAIGGIAASTAKAKGNLLAARTLATLADSIAKADGTIARLAGRAVGRYARAQTEVSTDDKSPQKPRLTFEKVSRRVRDVDANPLILEQRVRTQAGAWAQVAPSVYSSLLTSALRSQAFLSSKLPPPRNDPYSLTPHLEEGDLSDTEKYDFVQYAKAVDDPIAVLKDVADGTVTPQQIEALQAVYPTLYRQMRSEVMRRVSDLSQPLDYERSVNIGTLLQVDTLEVMTGEFQSMLADMYTARAESEKTDGGSKPRGVNSRLSKSVESAGQQMQTGGE